MCRPAPVEKGATSLMPVLPRLAGTTEDPQAGMLLVQLAADLKCRPSTQYRESLPDDASALQ